MTTVMIKKLREFFLAEASRLVTDAEQCFLALPAAPADPDLIAHLYQLAQNLSSGAKALSFSQVTAVAAALTRALEKLQREKNPATLGTIHLFKGCCEFLASMLADLALDQTKSFSLAPLCLELDALVPKGQLRSLPTSAPAAKTATLDRRAHHPSLSNPSGGQIYDPQGESAQDRQGESAPGPRGETAKELQGEGARDPLDVLASDARAEAARDPALDLASHTLDKVARDPNANPSRRIETPPSVKTPANVTDAQGRYLSFNLGTEQFAVPLLAIKEVTSLHAIRRLPFTSAPYLGIMTVRERIITVIDLRKKLGLASAPPSEEAVIVCTTGADQIGVIVDSINFVIAAGASELTPSPELKSPRKRDYIAGFLQCDQQLIIVLDIAAILRSEELQEHSNMMQRQA